MTLSNVIFHGSWLEKGLFLWAESDQPIPKTRGRKTELPPHPFTLPPDDLRTRLAELYPTLLWKDFPDLLRGTFLPSTSLGPILPPWFFPDSTLAEEPSPQLSAWKVSGLWLSPLAALDLLVPLPAHSSDRRWGSDLRYWAVAARLGLEFLTRQLYFPTLTEQAGTYQAVWKLIIEQPTDRARIKTLAEAMPPICRALFTDLKSFDPHRAPHPADLLNDFLAQLTDVAVRDWGRAVISENASPIEAADLWQNALWGPEGTFIVPLKWRREMATFHAEWTAWFTQLQQAGEAAFRLCFRLEAPELDPETGAVRTPEWTLRYLLQAHDDPSLLIPIEQAWSAPDDQLDYLNYRFDRAQERILSGLGLAARLFAPIRQSLRAARPSAMKLSVEEAYTFLRETGPLLESSGFSILVPPWWNQPGARLGVRVKLKADPSIIGRGLLTADSLINFDWELALGEETLSQEEFYQLAALKTPLVQIRGKWVLLDKKEVEAAIAFWEKQRRKQLTFAETLNLTLNPTATLAGLPLQKVETSGWLDEMLFHLRAGEKFQTDWPVPAGFVGQLRPYQLRGAAWLDFMERWGLGACLADDMGLGKTIQTLALLLRERETDPTLPPALLICPTSVVGNWKREAARFAPALRVMVHHGSDREHGAALAEVVARHDLVISSYGLVRRDIADLTEIPWSTVILDEAQNIKNAEARQSQAVRRLRTPHRLALTGTPVENRLSELWSIMQFLNPGFLGSQSRFRETFALPIERYQDAEKTAQLRNLVGPFILRRLKTDPTIIQDLPEKIEIKTYCPLTPEQATLYQAVVEESLQKIDTAAEEGDISRRGAILGALLRLKQICNHPAHYLNDGSALPERSGKLERLTEIIEELLENNERALIFTQFAEMGKLLQGYLQRLFGVEALYLHGATPPEHRDRMVARFQSPAGPPLFILSLKAGGVGLNLTAANHVFHFDRWWNPAVENQATDRAFRIGQLRNVNVYKLICAGTLEEKIDALIESKKALAQNVIGTGEDWLTGLNTDELREVLTLRQEE